MVLVRNITPPEEGLVYTSDNIQLKIANQTIGSGTLYISQDLLSWVQNDKLEGISILWKQISVHGISTNPLKCIYLMLDHQLVWEGVYDSLHARNGNGVPMDQNDDDDEEEDEGNESDNEEMTELWLTPSDTNSVETIFQAMTDCQALHPDSADSLSEESDFMDDGDVDGNDHMGAEGFGNANNDGGNATVQGDMENLNLNDRFADADE